MFTKLLLCIAALAFASTSVALANDGGIAVLQVKKVGGNAADGTTMTFSGESANKLMKLIPGAAYVGDPKYGDYTKSLAIGDGTNIIAIHCERGTLVQGAENGKPAVVKPVTPNCSIRFWKNAGDLADYGGDIWELNPYDQAKKILGIQ